MGMVLDMTLRDIERVLYFEAYVVIDPGMTPLKARQILTEDDYLQQGRRVRRRILVPSMGAEGIRELLRAIDVDERDRNAAHRTQEHRFGSQDQEVSRSA